MAKMRLKFLLIRAGKSYIFTAGRCQNPQTRTKLKLGLLLKGKFNNFPFIKQTVYAHIPRRTKVIKTKVVINVSARWFDLSDKALEKYSKLSNIPEYFLDATRIPRHCPHLVRIVEELGVEADTVDTALVVEEVKGDKYHILSTKEGVEYVITPEILNNIKWVKAI